MVACFVVSLFRLCLLRRVVSYVVVCRLVEWRFHVSFMSLLGGCLRVIYVAVLGFLWRFHVPFTSLIVSLVSLRGYMSLCRSLGFIGCKHITQT